MQAPEQVEPEALADYLEVMSKAVFQSGMSWKVVESKWPGLREAFREFDPETLTALTEPELDELSQDTRGIRNRRKIEAIIGNARQMLELESTHGSFRSYLRSHDDFESTVKDLRKQFKFLGEMGCYYFLHVVGEEVPSHEEWMASRK
ncbi:MAG: DNA-3-methyladenine glycosylase I [Chloroflexi bacterium]|nr:DNA-3-methyladenine glycosylase I [Chloroflexota bacterium]